MRIQDNTPAISKTAAGELKSIREVLRLIPDEVAPKVGAKTGADISAPRKMAMMNCLAALIAYATLAGIPFEDIIRDERDCR